MGDNRLLSILMILLHEDKVTTAQLAERFEVSKRTICRDIDRLGSSGVPLICYRGRNGGVSLLSEFKLEKNYLTELDVRLLLHSLSFYLKCISYKDVSNQFFVKDLRALTDKLSAISPESARKALDAINSYYEVELDECFYLWETPGVKPVYQGMKLEKRVALQISGRRVEACPLRLVVRPSGTSLFAYCEGSYCLLPFKDIEKAEVLEEPFNREDFISYKEYNERKAENA